MEIHLNTSIPLSSSSNSPQLKIGDIIPITIKNQINKTDAVVSIKGETATVKFEGAIPKGENVAVEITGFTEDGQMIVKASDKNTSPGQMLKNLESTANESVKAFTSKGMPLTRENVASIKAFLSNAKYPMDKKMETLRLMAQKQIAISDVTLEAVYQGLNGKSLTQSFMSLMEQLDSKPIINIDPFLMEIERQPNLETAIRLAEDFLKGQPVPKQNLENIILEFKDIGPFVKTKEHFIRTFTTALKEIDTFDFTSDSINVNGDDTNSSKLDQNVPSLVETDINELSRAEQSVIKDAIHSLKLDSQNILVTEITKKLSQLTLDFKSLKQDITKNLDMISKVLENPKPQANVKQILESTIHKLDNAILKGEFLLYTDMGTEKKLLKASTQLAEAKKLLANGEVAEANKKVMEVKESIAKLVFQPSDVKVKHFVSNRFGLEGPPSNQLGKLMEQVTKPFTNGESSPRQMIDVFRKVGITHENEVSHSLLSRMGSSGNQQQSENVKTMLLKMLNSHEEIKPQQKVQVEQAITSIAGQQLLNKQDSSGQQNLFFQLPFKMDEQIENIKIYVNSKKEGNKVDWENCSIYFVLETKKLGEIGVLMSSSDRNVNLTFNSNKEQLPEKVSDFEEIVKERFKEIGYNLGNMNVKALHKKEDVPSIVEKKKPQKTTNLSEKGYDISI